jgi:hypothetical protein
MARCIIGGCCLAVKQSLWLVLRNKGEEWGVKKAGMGQIGSSQGGGVVVLATGRSFGDACAVPVDKRRWRVYNSEVQASRLCPHGRSRIAGRGAPGDLSA